MKIKNLIEYYYNIKINHLYKNRRQYRFSYFDNQYLFLPLNRYEDEIIEVNHLIKGNHKYDQIMINIENSIITHVQNYSYILIKKVSKKIGIEEIIEKPYYLLTSKKMYKNIDRSNWLFLWSEKIDYIEYQLIHLDKEYPLLRDSINYFIGMAENAISYVYNTYHLLQSKNDNLVISHKRIRDNEFNNPLNLIIDYKSRDIAEYLKYIFFNDDYDYIKIKGLLSYLNLDQFSCQLIYARLLFPTYYFDKYDEIIGNNLEEKEILSILKRTEEYEDYIINIYMIINQLFSIERIDWL
ncbi:MAG: hypothetical protein HFJ12_07455 [Bacilli bacterium]|nr:hypothetical protein [Bacilli bacterium]